MGYQEITTLDDLKKLIRDSGDKLVVVEFSASFCGPDYPMTKVVKDFSTIYTVADFARVEVDVVPDVADNYFVGDIPAVMFFKKGEKVDEAGDKSGDFTSKLVDLLV